MNDISLHSRRVRFAETQFASLQSQEDEEGDVLGAARWLVVCILFVAAAALSAAWGLS